MLMVSGKVLAGRDASGVSKGAICKGVGRVGELT